MNRKLLSILISLLVLFGAGCTKNNDDQGQPNQEDEGTGLTISEPVVSEVVSDLKIEGDIKNIYYANEGNALISADKLYLYDVGTQNVVKESKEETFASENIWVIDSGYVAVRETVNSNNDGSMMMDGGFDFNITFYDYDLNAVSEFDLNQLFEEDDFVFSLDAISFSSTGNEVAYATYSGLYTYDFEKEAKTTVIDLESADAGGRAGIVNIEQIGFTKDDQRIAFKAQSFDVPLNPNKDSFDTCGIVNSDGSALSNRTFDNYICKELIAYNHLLLFAEDPMIASGRTLVMEPSGDQTKIHALIEKEESGNVWGSSEGSYFATSTPQKTGWAIRVYDAETGKLEAEQQVSSDGEALYMARNPVIKVMDDSKTVIVLLGATQEDIETKMFVTQF